MEKSRASDLKVYRTKCIVTSEHYLAVPVDDLVGALSERLKGGKDDELTTQNLKDFVRLVEGIFRFQFSQLQRGLLNDFRPFASGADGKKLLVTPTEEKRLLSRLDAVEGDFLETLFKLLTAAHFQLLAKDEWDACISEEFQVTLPVTVNWSKMDPSLPARFWAAHKEERAYSPDEVADHILVFHRGVEQDSFVHADVNKKVQMIVEYVLLFPLVRLLIAVLGLINKALKQASVVRLMERLSSTLPDDYAAVEASESTATKQVADSQKAYADASEAAAKEDAPAPNPADTPRGNAGTRGKLCKVLDRKSLRRTFPTLGSCVKGLLAKRTLQEPAFRDIIVVYRDKKAEPTKEEQEEMSPLELQLRQRNISIKRFYNVPMADMEMVFPSRKLHLQPVTLVSLFASLVGGLVAAWAMVAKAEMNLSLAVSVLGLVGGRLAQVWGEAQNELMTLEREMNLMVYRKNVASQEAVLFMTLNDMLEQHVKESVLLYFTLLAAGRPMSLSAVEASTVKLLKDSFGVDISLDVDHVLPSLVEEGIVRKQGNLLSCVSLAEGLKLMDEKWDNLFGYSEGTEEVAQTPGIAGSFSDQQLPAPQSSSGGTFSFSKLMRRGSFAGGGKRGASSDGIRQRTDAKKGVE